MLAARQVASLLAMVRHAELGQAPELPKPLSAGLPKPVLLRIVVEILKDPSDVVRAEMLAAMGAVPLDDKIVVLFAPVIEDRSALVRFRVAELLGASGIKRQNTIVDYMAQDADEMVRLMASAFKAK
jgi:HEAT repeat protein